MSAQRFTVNVVDLTHRTGKLAHAARRSSVQPGWNRKQAEKLNLAITEHSHLSRRQQIRPNWQNLRLGDTSTGHTTSFSFGMDGIKTFRWT